MNSTTQKTLRELRIVPKRPLNERQVASRMAKWTTLPAMRKRAASIPDEFFESDEMLSGSDARKFPRLTYLASRYFTGRPWGPYTQRFENTRAAAVALTGAYRARCWRDEHGQWPTAQQFAASLASDASLEWHVTTAPGPLVSQFMATHDIPAENRLSETLSRDYCIGYLDSESLMKYLERMSVSAKDLAFEAEGIPRSRLIEEWKGRTVFFPRPPDILPMPLAGSEYYRISETRKPPRSDVTLVRAIPEDPKAQLSSMLDRKVDILCGDVLKWARANFEAFRPLVISATTVNPFPDSDPHLQLEGFAIGSFSIRERLPGGGYRSTDVDLGDPAANHWWNAHLEAVRPHVVVGLRLPKRSYWVTHPGPDGKPDGLNLIYDPSNGLTSRGDIVQLAGWDW